MVDALRTFDQQKTNADNQALRTLGIPVAYKNAAGTTKTIRAIFRNREVETDDGITRILVPQPELRARTSDIDDRDRDTATFTVNGTVYRPDTYNDDGMGLMKIQLRT